MGYVPRHRPPPPPRSASLTLAGLGPARIRPGATERWAGEAAVEHVLVPRLRSGQNVILDSLRAQRGGRVPQRVAAGRCQRWGVPRYASNLAPRAPACAPLQQAFGQHGQYVLIGTGGDTQVQLGRVHIQQQSWQEAAPDAHPPRALVGHPARRQQQGVMVLLVIRSLGCIHCLYIQTPSRWTCRHGGTSSLLRGLYRSRNPCQFVLQLLHVLTKRGTVGLVQHRQQLL